MAKTDDKGSWLDPRGVPVPKKFIPKVDQRRDQAVEKIHKAIGKLEKQMTDAKRECLGELTAYLDFLEKETGVARQGKGNLTLTGFSGDKQVDLRIDDVIEFDERLQSAKTLIDEYVADLGTSSAEEIVALVREAFNLDKKKNVNQAMIMRLLKLQFKDPRWVRAVELIHESISVAGSRQYLQIRRKIKTPSGSEQWEPVPLNFSAI